MPADFDAYFRALAETARADDDTEQTDRPELKALLQGAAQDGAAGTRITHEPRRDKAGKGSPDFAVTRAGRVIGYVEVKPIDENLSKVLNSDQIKKYKALSPNLILTDYLEFIWIRPGVEVERVRLAHSTDLQAKKLALKPEAVAGVRKLLDAFFSEAPQKIGRAEELSKALAKRAALLRDFLAEELARQAKAKTQGKLHGLFEVFRSQVFHELTTPDFADAFAQMLTYGLFLARLNAPAATAVDLSNVRKLIPGSFRLIRELVQFLEEMGEPEYRPAAWIVDEILSIVNGIELASVQADLSFRARKAISRKVRAGDEEEHRLFERDPFIYFYEDFLKAYDPAMRKGRGVYYTPPPVVNFIVRAVDDILKSEFKIKDGLADKNKVTVLDFACGTGTFLLEVFERIFDNIGGADSGKARAVVDEHLTKNVYGFEYLIAPYTIAHLKLSQYLADKKLPLIEGERLQVFLTNTLEPIEPQASLLLPALSAEAEEAQAIKDKPVLVIVGNPPYSGHSKNMGADARASVEAYRHGFPELSKPAQGKWLQDDYVKFIRFAQTKMDAVEEGVVGVISNHSWLDNPTFKGMRKSLMQTFDQMYVLDLHGNTKKKERTPTGDVDDNVFDIEQGVAIAIFVKKPDSERGVWHGDLWGKRLTKYEALASGALSANAAAPLEPEAPDWLIRPQDKVAVAAYRDLWAVPDIFSQLGDPAPGFVTTQDQFAISFSAQEAREKVQMLLSAKDEAEARRTFRLCTQDQWNYDRATAELPHLDLDQNTVEVTYRPFDERWTIWDRNVTVHRRERVMRHMFSHNVALLTARSNKSPTQDHFFVADKPSETKAAESTIQSYSFPLYEKISSSPNDLRENISPSFRDYLDRRYRHHLTPEQIFGYIYAALYASTYRRRYAEFLRAGFPRIPFPETREAFEAMSELGWELAQVHLLRTKPDHALADFPEKGSDEVEFVRYAPKDEAIEINAHPKTKRVQRFAPVPQAVWDFHIGGYQVLDKYLKSRKGRKLSLDEINHVADIAGALQFTLAQMARIDAAYLAAFPDRAKASDGGG